MQEPVEQVKSLDDKCPICGFNLYAFWHTPSSDHPELGVWYVECNNNNCNYQYDDCFPNLEWLSKEFNIS